MEKYTVEKMSKTRTRYTFDAKTTLGGHLMVDISECRPDNDNNNSLPRLVGFSGRTKMEGFTGS